MERRNFLRNMLGIGGCGLIAPSMCWPFRKIFIPAVPKFDWRVGDWMYKDGISGVYYWAAGGIYLARPGDLKLLNLTAPDPDTLMTIETFDGKTERYTQVLPGELMKYPFRFNAKDPTHVADVDCSIASNQLAEVLFRDHKKA